MWFCQPSYIIRLLKLLASGKIRGQQPLPEKKPIFVFYYEGNIA